jgi:hypothetical protein
VNIQISARQASTLAPGRRNPPLPHKHLSSLLLQLNSGHAFTRISHCEPESRSKRILGRLYRFKNEEKSHSIFLCRQRDWKHLRSTRLPLRGRSPTTVRQPWAFLRSYQALPLSVSTGGLVAVRKQRDEKSSTSVLDFSSWIHLDENDTFISKPVYMPI